MEKIESYMRIIRITSSDWVRLDTRGSSVGQLGQSVRRWQVASRVLAGALPGYLLANTVGLLLAIGLPVSKISGIAIGTMASFLIWAVAVMWAFCVPKARTAWLGLSGAVAATGVAAWLLYLLENLP